MKKDISIKSNGVTFVIKDTKPIPDNIPGTLELLKRTESQEAFLVRMINGTPPNNKRGLTIKNR